MNKNLQIILFFIIATNLSFAVNNGKLVCEQVNSSLGFAKKYTTKASESKKIHLLKFNTFKAIGTLQKLNDQLKSCGCDIATNKVKNGLTYLKSATKTESLDIAKELLSNAQKEINSGIESVVEFNSEKNRVAKEPIELDAKPDENIMENLSYPKIDAQLNKFRNSMLNLVQSSDCKKTKAYANSIYEDCVKNLIKPNLPKIKIYYFIKTKKIALETIESLGDCK